MRGSRSGVKLNSAVRAQIGRSSRTAAAGTPKLARDGSAKLRLLARLTGELARRDQATSGARAPTVAARRDRGLR